MGAHQNTFRKLLFYRDFERYSGGHGKVWDYFTHAGSIAGWEPAIFLTPGSVVEQNPWHAAGVAAEPHWAPEKADALLLGGMDWNAYPLDIPDTPVINLIQHVRHGDPADPRHPFLQRRAIRICVSGEVAKAISRNGGPNGPVLVIEAAVQLPRHIARSAHRAGVFIDALKQPELGRRLAGRLRADGLQVDLNDQRTPRDDYLARLGRAQVAVTLPRATEGFYLPGLEAMALGCAAVVPDCVGNRAYLDPGRNALVPSLDVDDLTAAVTRLQAPDLRKQLAEAGRQTAERFGMDRERDAFKQVLSDLDQLWRY